MSVESVTRGGTRDEVRHLLLTLGPQTAAEIAEELGLTPAGVRRHLESLEADGDIESVRRPAAGTRGRPARAFQLTHRGRSDHTHGYDRLAADALTALRAVGGEQAVADFARDRVRAVIGHVKPATDRDDAARAAREIAEALTEAGYAASVDAAPAGVQICQHHCPVWNVAERFPELCQAEQDVVSEIVGTHVQRLSTIAGGNCACTTHIPTTTTVTSADDLRSTAARAASTEGTTR